MVVDDLDFEDKAKHQAHVDARIEVWQKGYGLLCYVDGVLYVYAVKPKVLSKADKRKEAKKQLNATFLNSREKMYLSSTSITAQINKAR